MKRRRTYTKEFKKQAVSMISRSDKTLRSVAQSLGIPTTNLIEWVRKAEEKGSVVYEGSEPLTPEQAEISRLKKALQDTEMERDILKEAITIFGKKKP